MIAPNYRWVCARCSPVYEAGIAVCTDCGMGSRYTIAQIEGGPARKERPWNRRNILWSAPLLLAMIALEALAYFFLPPPFYLALGGLGLFQAVFYGIALLAGLFIAISAGAKAVYVIIRKATKHSP